MTWRDSIRVISLCGGAASSVLLALLGELTREDGAGRLWVWLLKQLLAVQKIYTLPLRWRAARGTLLSIRDGEGKGFLRVRHVGREREDGWLFLQYRGRRSRGVRILVGGVGQSVRSQVQTNATNADPANESTRSVYKVVNVRE